MPFLPCLSQLRLQLSPPTPHHLPPIPCRNSRWQEVLDQLSSPQQIYGQYEWYALVKSLGLPAAAAPGTQFGNSSATYGGAYFFFSVFDGFANYFDTSAGADGGNLTSPFGIGGVLNYPDMSKVRADVLSVNFGGCLLIWPTAKEFLSVFLPLRPPPPPRSHTFVA